MAPAIYKVIGRSMRMKDFDLSRYDRGQNFSLDLELGSEAPGIALPLFLVRGASEGKTLVVTAGVHGDEFEGVQAILEVVAELDPSIMSVTMIAVPAANPPAFYEGTRTSPLDGRNLARSFPGAERGTPTEVLAFHLSKSIIACADFYLDLHSAGTR
ncbi:MAG: succinylglutamate desuccinylase/aspartoacylase family protein, partial [Terriglobales bacterium]